MKKIIYISSLLICFTILFSCSEDFFETEPTTEISEDLVFTNIGTVKLAINGIYDKLTMPYPFCDGVGGFIMPEIMGNDVLVRSVANYFFWVNQYNYQLTSYDFEVIFLYRDYYSIIDNANQIIKYTPELDGDKEEKDAIIGEALALRAYAYFKLVQYFGEYAYTYNPDARGVPLVTVPLNAESPGQPRASVSAVYEQIVKDLEDAVNMMVDGAYDGHLTQRAAYGLLARVYLTMGDWTNASTYAKLAYEGMTLMNQAEYLSGFNNPTSETIWTQRYQDNDNQGFYSVPSFYYEASGYDAAGNPINPVFGFNTLRVTENLINLYSDTDFRKQMFPLDQRLVDAGDPFPYAQGQYQSGYWVTKWKSRTTVGTGDFIWMRASEFYLIEAEAEANLNNLGAARDALFVIQSRADATVTRASLDAYTTKEDLLDEIYKERRRELCCEGFSFFDIKRLGLPLDRTTSTNHWSPTQTIEANSNRFCLPLPQEEIDANDALTEADQNEAYR